MWIRWTVSVVAAIAVLGIQVPVRACGPATHAREAGIVFDAVVESFPEWAAIADVPLARAWIQFGAMAPDFQNATTLIKFGHATSLSLHLLAEAQDLDPEYRWFALGHLAHNSSDNSCESFYTGAMVGSAPLGMFDFALDDRGALGESEGIVEVFGDAITGDWDAMVDVLWDFWLAGEEARQRAQAAFAWYCETGSAFHNKDTDCQEAYEDFLSKLDSVDKYLGGFDRETAKELVHNLLDLSLPDLADLFMSGTIQAILGDAADMPATPWAHKELERMKQSALMDLDFWDQYFDHFQYLGTGWTLDRLLEGASVKWPTWDGNAMICGNIQSVMQFLPDGYDVTPGLLVDDVTWLDDKAKKIKKMTVAQAGKTLTVRVRFFAAFPFQGTVTGVVRRDRPGLDSSQDDTLGQASVTVDIDPFEYVWNDRTVLDIPFTADPTDARGFYLELTVDGSDGPTFTTSWDRLWTIGDLELDRGVYVDNFGTYGFWPPSLPVENPGIDDAALFAKVRIAPAGDGIGSATVGLEENGDERTTGDNGIAPFGGLSDGTWTLVVIADGYQAEGPVTVALEPLETAWINVPLHPVPAVKVPSGFWSNRSALPFSWDVAPFGDQAGEFLAWSGTGEAPEPEAPYEAGLTGESVVAVNALVEDGDALRVGVQARYVDGTLGVAGFSDPVVIDGSPPLVTDMEVTVPEDAPCIPHPEQLPYQPPVDVEVSFEEPHTSIGSVHWRVGDLDWTEADWTLKAAGDVSGRVAFSLDLTGQAPGSLLLVRLTNLAGASAAAGPAKLPQWDGSHLCQSPETPAPEPSGADAIAMPETSPWDDSGEAGDGSSPGCSSRPVETPPGGAGIFGLAAALFLLGIRRFKV